MNNLAAKWQEHISGPKGHDILVDLAKGISKIQTQNHGSNIETTIPKNAKGFVRKIDEVLALALTLSGTGGNGITTTNLQWHIAGNNPHITLIAEGSMHGRQDYDPKGLTLSSKEPLTSGGNIYMCQREANYGNNGTLVSTGLEITSSITGSTINCDRIQAPAKSVKSGHSGYNAVIKVGGGEKTLTNGDAPLIEFPEGITIEGVESYLRTQIDKFLAELSKRMPPRGSTAN